MYVKTTQNITGNLYRNICVLVGSNYSHKQTQACLKFFWSPEQKIWIMEHMNFTIYIPPNLGRELSYHNSHQLPELDYHKSPGLEMRGLPSGWTLDGYFTVLFLCILGPILDRADCLAILTGRKCVSARDYADLITHMEGFSNNGELLSIFFDE